jgi:hypothetical protein
MFQTGGVQAVDEFLGQSVGQATQGLGRQLLGAELEQ